MHYERGQCRRHAMPDDEFCRQHRGLRNRYGEYFITRWSDR
jgi:hypothetical protein